MKLREFHDILKAHDFKYHRPGKGSHEIWRNSSGDEFSIPTNGKIGKGLVWQFRRKISHKIC